MQKYYQTQVAQSGLPWVIIYILTNQKRGDHMSLFKHCHDKNVAGAFYYIAIIVISAASGYRRGLLKTPFNFLSLKMLCAVCGVVFLCSAINYASQAYPAFSSGIKDTLDSSIASDSLWAAIKSDFYWDDIETRRHQHLPSRPLISILSFTL